MLKLQSLRPGWAGLLGLITVMMSVWTAVKIDALTDGPGRRQRKRERRDQAKQLRDSLGAASRDRLSGKAVLVLVDTGCRTQADVLALDKKAVVALPAEKAQEVAVYLLRERLGRTSKGDVSLGTLSVLLQKDCRTLESVAALSSETIADLPTEASEEVT